MLHYDLYLSGPMTGIKDKNHTQFSKAAHALRTATYAVMNPWELDKTTPCSTWEESLRRDIAALMRCKGIATLPGWKKSKGASLEVYIAKTLKWSVHPVSYWLKEAKLALH
jgi:hypothetical protein